MYPFIRMGFDLARFSRAESLGPLDTHISSHRVWPWDLDMFFELNNGRTLTLYDIGRVTLAQRSGLLRVMRQKKWGLTVAGLSVRFRRRVRVFQRVEARCTVVGWDARFLYIDQSMWRADGECTSQILARTAVTDHNGIVPTDKVIAAMGDPIDSPVLPVWVAAWVEADAIRSWPPVA